MAPELIAGVFDSLASAERARRALLAVAIHPDRVALSAHLTADALAGEAPGQLFENQPGEDQSVEAAQCIKFAEAVLTGACVLTVRADSVEDCQLIEDLLKRLGARGTPRRGLFSRCA